MIWHEPMTKSFQNNEHWAYDSSGSDYNPTITNVSNAWRCPIRTETCWEFCHPNGTLSVLYYDFVSTKGYTNISLTYNMEAGDGDPLFDDWNATDPGSRCILQYAIRQVNTTWVSFASLNARRSQVENTVYLGEETWDNAEGVSIQISVSQESDIIEFYSLEGCCYISDFYFGGIPIIPITTDTLGMYKI